MDTKELEEAARYSLQCKKASLEELRAMEEETRGKKGRKVKNERKESAGTQLALQGAEEALARTREERDALRRKVAELREEIEHLRNDVAWWRGEAKGQELLADALAKENAWLKAKVAVKERTENG